VVNRPEEIRAVLTDSRTWFVVGLSDNPDRDALGVARYLQQRGKRIVPIHPRAQTVHGEPGYATVAEAVDAVGAPDVVDVFVNSRRAGEIADQAVAGGARCVWFQLGVIDDDAAQRVTDAGITMVMDRCPLVEYPRLLD
jgi:uncharacterized protein